MPPNSHPKHRLSWLETARPVPNTRHRIQRTYPLRMEPLESRRLLAGDLSITELMASNDNTLLDEDGDASDWFEVHNPTQDPITLLNYSATDDPENLNKWQFADLTLQPGDFLVVFASGKDRAGDDIDILVRRDFAATPDGTFLVDSRMGRTTSG